MKHRREPAATQAPLPDAESARAPGVPLSSFLVFSKARTCTDIRKNITDELSVQREHCILIDCNGHALLSRVSP